jgi:DNA-directed RNA polymerase subunit RPC12/RpoP
LSWIKPGTLASVPTAVAHRRDFTCPACGAAMAFDPARSALACAACGHTRVLPAPAADAQAEALREQDYLDALRRLAAREPSLEARVVDCPSCGAQTRFEGHVVGDACAFCASPLLVEQAHVQRLIRAQAVLPFALDKAAAQRVFAQWVGSRWFAPNALKATVREADGVKGIYLPWWTYDAATITTYRGERGVQRRVQESRPNATAQAGAATTRVVTDWSPASGAVPVGFDDIIVAGSPSIAPHLARVLDQWDLSRLRPPADEVLAGFGVEVYRTGLEAGFGIARERIQPAIDAAIRRDIGGNVQRIHAKQTLVDDIRFKHLLMPVWIGSYRFGGKPYQIVVNGQSGEVEGDRPWSKWKIALAVLLALLALLLLMQLQQG